MAVFTVSQVNMYIKSLFDEIPPIQNIYIKGEISNFKHYNRGHMYFTLKDSKSQLKCVMFSGDNYKLRFEPENGMKVVCFGQIGVYERDGVYQLYVRDMQVDGVGDLQVAFEQLKSKLESEGLFEQSHKKPIPMYPKKIGVVTSNMGAAVEDIKNVISRRYPLCEIVISPTIVQGELAAPDIVRSIRFLDSVEGIDTIIVGRGGGSIEDLWAFNTEEVARAVYLCNTPIISAVGHETDTTICDFVADMRAPTPSAAAELAVPDINHLKLNVANLASSLNDAIEKIAENEQTRLDYIKNKSALSNRGVFFEKLFASVQNSGERINLAFKNRIENEGRRISGIARALTALSPLEVLSRGYSITKHDGKVVAAIDGLKVGDTITVVLSDGEISADVTEVK
ncbi:MAG: exodeoxyribonuclease VII large subunit [Ruminococcaceae bacterium]|nr:exodeoxyribonuclease VII large subunit [Oscillospiraceae bacterium]